MYVCMYYMILDSKLNSFNKRSKVWNRTYYLVIYSFSLRWFISQSKSIDRSTMFWTIYLDTNVIFLRKVYPIFLIQISVHFLIQLSTYFRSKYKIQIRDISTRSINLTSPPTTHIYVGYVRTFQKLVQGSLWNSEGVCGCLIGILFSLEI